MAMLLTLYFPAFAIEEQRYQARVIVPDIQKPHGIFPLPEPDFFHIEKQFMDIQDKREYISWEPVENTIVVDLCGFQTIESSLQEGEENINA